MDEKRHWIWDIVEGMAMALNPLPAQNHQLYKRDDMKALSGDFEVVARDLRVAAARVKREHI